MDRLFVLLQQEGYLFRSCLTTGLTALRKADLNDPGLYYTAFFQISIGLERLLKSIIIIEHISAHGSAPNEKQLRRHGHDLLGLAREASREQTPAADMIREVLEPGSINALLISFLSNFALNSRYFNLNALVGASQTKDPIAEWNQVVSRVLSEDEDPKKVEWLRSSNGLDGSALRMSRLFNLRQAEELASKHVVARLVRVIATLRERLSEVVDGATQSLGSTEAMQIPYMIEFLNFTYGTDAENRRKKRWP